MSSFCDACKNGDINQVLLIINQVGDNPLIKLNYNEGLRYACYYGYKNLALLMIEKGANIYQEGLCSACYYGHKELVLLMIEKRDMNLNYNWALSSACSGGHKELVLLMIEKGANDYNDGLHGACYGVHKELIYFMIEKGADINKCSIDLIFDDIYYLYQKGLKRSLFGKYKKVALQCEKIKQTFKNIAKEIFISDIVNIVIDY